MDVFIFNLLIRLMQITIYPLTLDIIKSKQIKCIFSKTGGSLNRDHVNPFIDIVPLLSRYFLKI